MSALRENSGAASGEHHHEREKASDEPATATSHAMDVRVV
jgi:hypothetical protein